MELLVDRRVAEEYGWHDGQALPVVSDDFEGVATLRIVGIPLPPILGGSAPEPPPKNGFRLPFGPGAGQSIADVSTARLRQLYSDAAYKDYPALEAAIEREIARRSPWEKV